MSAVDDTSSVTVLAPAHDSGEVTVDAHLDGDRVLLDPGALAAATGWELRPEGACRGPRCVPLRDPARATSDDLVDVRALADALGAPFAAEPELGVVALGEPAALRAEAMDTLDAPDITLERVDPAGDGERFTFSSVGRRKKVLVAWASW